MNQILIIDGCMMVPNSNPLIDLIGSSFIILIIALVIIEKGEKSKKIDLHDTSEKKDSFFIEKDVLMMDKTSYNHSELTYKSANKSNFGIIILIIVFLLGLAIVFWSKPRKRIVTPSNTGMPYHEEVKQTVKVDQLNN